MGGAGGTDSERRESTAAALSARPRCGCLAFPGLRSGCGSPVPEQPLPPQLPPTSRSPLACPCSGRPRNHRQLGHAPGPVVRAAARLPKFPPPAPTAWAPEDERRTPKLGLLRISPTPGRSPPTRPRDWGGGSPSGRAGAGHPGPSLLLAPSALPGVHALQRWKQGQTEACGSSWG